MGLSCPIIAVPLFSTKVAFTQFQADYRFRRTANSTRSWSAMAESLAGNMSLPLSVPSFLHLGWKWCWCCNYVFACFCSISQDQFYSYSFLPKAFESLCFYTLSRLSMFLDLTVVWCVNNRCCGNPAVWSVCCSLYSSSIFPESRQYEILYMFQVHIQKGNHRFGCFGHSKL